MKPVLKRAGSSFFHKAAGAGSGGTAPANGSPGPNSPDSSPIPIGVMRRRASKIVPFPNMEGSNGSSLSNSTTAAGSSGSTLSINPAISSILGSSVEDKADSPLKSHISRRKGSLQRTISLPVFDVNAPTSLTSNLKRHNTGVPITSSAASRDHLTYKGLRAIRVLHRKREQSHEDDPALHFEFEWEMAITFDPEMEEILNVTVQVLDLSTSSHVSKERKEDLIRAFRGFMSEEFPYQMLLKKPCKQLSIHKDLPSLAKILHVIDSQARMVSLPYFFFPLFICQTKLIISVFSFTMVALPLYLCIICCWFCLKPYRKILELPK
jgi:hypothetical protein